VRRVQGAASRRRTLRREDSPGLTSLAR
jgi:hypothetical protein